MSKRKVLDVECRGQKIICIKSDAGEKPYRVYRKSWSMRQDGCGMGEHREQIAKCGDMVSVLFFVYDYFARA